MAALGAGEAGRHDVWAHQHLLVRQPVRHHGEVGHRIRHQHVFRLTAVDRVAEFPAADRLESVLGPRAVLAEAAAQAGGGVTGRRNGASYDSLAFLEAGDRGAKLLNDAHRLVADDEAGANRILALQDVNVGAADCCCGDPHQRVKRTDVRDRLLVQHDPSPLDEHCCFHFRHHLAPLMNARSIGVPTSGGIDLAQCSDGAGGRRAITMARGPTAVAGSHTQRGQHTCRHHKQHH